MMADYVMTAGVNGVGKSTLYTTDFYKIIGSAAENRINPDEELVKFGGRYDNESDQRRAGKISAEKLKAFLNQRLSFNQETTFSGSSEKARIERAKALGFRIVMFYVGVDSAETAKTRVKLRVAKGGHNIPDKIVEKRYQRSIDNLKKLSNLMDELHIFDNTEVTAGDLLAR